MKKLTVFLGGTTNSKWRDKLIPMLNNKISAFNPIVEKWTEQARVNELLHREQDDILLYVFSPLRIGYYSIAEVIDDSNKRPNKTIFCILEEDEGKKFSIKENKSLEAIKKIVKNNGATFACWDKLAEKLNSLV